MPGESLHLTRTIPSRPENVWYVLTELDEFAGVVEDITKIDVLTNGAYGVGTRWRETRKMMGMEGSEEMEVVDNDPFRKTVVEAVNGDVTYRTVFELTPNEAGTVTTLSMDFSAKAPEQKGLKKVLTNTMGKLGMKMTSKAMTKDLEAIAAAAIARG